MTSRKFPKGILTLLFLALAVRLSFQPAQAQTEPPPPDVPSGFRMILAAEGVELYQKNYAKGNPDFVQIVNLGAGSKVELLHGEIEGPGEGRGVYGGNNPKFSRLSLGSFWREAKEAHQEAFCIVNGGFFYLPDSPSRLAFPLKKDGVVISDGYGIKEYPEQKLMLELWPGYANITDLTPEGLYSSSAPDILGGLTEAANKRARQHVGRTFIGIDDRNGDSLFETVLIFSTLSAQQVDAAEVLRGFGADKVMMLDGGGSTQLACNGNDYITSERVIPQAVAVIAAGVILEPVSEATSTLTSTQEPITATITASPENTLPATEISATETPPPVPTPIINDQQGSAPGIPFWSSLLEGQSAQARGANLEDQEMVAPEIPDQIDLVGLLIIPAAILPISALLMMIVVRRRNW